MLVFDNIDNPKLFSIKNPQAYDIKLYFSGTYHGFILIITKFFRLKIGKVYASQWSGFPRWVSGRVGEWVGFWVGFRP